MSIDLSRVTGISDSRGVITEIKDSLGRVIWAAGGKPVVLTVEKITSDTYAGETTYTGEQFILLDIYPKTNGTVKVTYGGLTKTITDTTGAAAPNAREVFFGTFNGVSDSVATPASGELTIEGDYEKFTLGGFREGNKSIFDTKYKGLTAIKDLGDMISIEASAFDGCTGLTSVTIGNRVTSIGDYAFNGCTGLTSVTIGNRVTSIGANPWRSFVGNNIITVDSGNTAYKIDGDCLIETATNALVSGFANTSIPSYVEVIKEYAFFQCTSLAITSLPNSITSIGNSAFYGCTSLALTELPSGITAIGMSAFNGCTKLALTSLPNSITSIGDSTFRECKSITSIAIPYGVASIGNYAFADCIKATSITIPDSVTSIGDKAFQGCESLVSITIPDSVTSIGEYAFYYCEKVRYVYIGDGLSVLSKYSFSGVCDNAKAEVYIRVGRGVTSMESHAIGTPYDMNPTIIEMLPVVPPTIIESDANNQSIGEYWDQIIVPKGCLSTYLSDSEWNALSSRISIVEAT